LPDIDRREAIAWLIATLAAALVDIGVARAAAPRDCPLREAPFSVDTPLLDILLSPTATAALREEPAFARFLDHAQPMMLRTTTPSFAAIVTPRSLTSWARLAPEALPAVDARLRRVTVTATDRRLRCARYDDTPPALPALPRDRPAMLVFEKITGFRDEPSVRAAHDALDSLARQLGWSVVFTEQAGVMRPTLLAKFAVVVWNNVSGDVLTSSQRAAFRAYVERGGGFVGIHGSGGDPVGFWPWYLDELVGARFLGHPMAPQFQTATVTLSDRGRSLAPNLPASWSMKDEWYSFVANPRASGAQVVATLDESTYEPTATLAMGADHPIAWTRQPRKGRAFYTAIGHLPETYEDPRVLELLRSGIRWAAAGNLGARATGARGN